MSSLQFCRPCLDFYKTRQTRLFSERAALCLLCNHSFTIWQNLSLWNLLLSNSCLLVIIQPLRVRSLECEEALKEYFKVMDRNLCQLKCEHDSMELFFFFWSSFEKKEDLILKASGGSYLVTRQKWNNSERYKPSFFLKPSPSPQVTEPD